MTDSSRHYELLAGLVALAGFALIFIFCLDILKDSGTTLSHVIRLRPGYETWAWGILTATEIVYGLIRKLGSLENKVYINPLFRLILRLAQITPAISFLLSWLTGNPNGNPDSILYQAAYASTQFLNSIFILFIFMLLGAGLNGIRKFSKKT